MGIFLLRKDVTEVERDRALQSCGMIRRVRHGQLTPPHNTETWGYEMHCVRRQLENQHKQM